jgi:hypothetical protein
MNAFLTARLRRVIRRHQWRRVSYRLAVVWAIAAAVGLVVLMVQAQFGWSSLYSFPAIAALAACGAMLVVWRSVEERPNTRTIAHTIEKAYPELRGLLLTAVEQLEADDGGEGSYLRYRVLQQAVEHCQETGNWRAAVPTLRVRAADLVHGAALVLFVGTFWVGRENWRKESGGVGATMFAARGLTVSPGDTTLERGESLVVLARFGGALPAGVELVVNDGSGPARTIPLVKSLADPVFGGTVPDVATDFVYRIDTKGERSRDFKVTVFEYPRLVRSDAELVFPGYTALPPRRIEDTRRVSAVEGTQLSVTFQLNKPVATAKLVARGKEKTEIPLAVVDGKAVATLTGFTLTATQSYDVKLTDAEGRENKSAPPLVVEVLPNRTPELKLISPRGDVRPSALEEIAFEGTVWDDFGVPAYGLAYTVAGQETKVIELGRTVAAKVKQPFAHLVRLEELKVKPDDLVSWYLWADDIGPDGLVRRTTTDMFFAEVRPFEEIFRESQEMQGEPPEGQAGGGEQTRKLAELQKQIIAATWKLVRTPGAGTFGADVAVVTQSQAQAVQQAEVEAGKATGPRGQALWAAVIKAMENAKGQLELAAKSPEALKAALTAEQAAYQALLKLQARETSVTKNRNRSQGGDSQGDQRELDGLDLDQSENRYETKRQANSPQSPERREQNQVLNRLQELSRRQQDVNERLKELQTSLEAARTAQEKEEVRRQLKRLQDEQKQMVADMDEVRQRMDRPENQSAMQEQREQLDRTRAEAQKAADAAGKGEVSQALAAGTRAQRDLQQMRDELRKSSSSEFAEDLKEMRNEARELALEQEEISKKIAGLDDPKQKTLGEAPEKDAALQQLAEQQKRMSELINKATQLSEQAENSEPLLSRQLYDSVRRIAQDDGKAVKDTRQELLEQGNLTRSFNERLKEAEKREGSGKALELTKDLLQQGLLPQAGQAGRRAAAGIDELRKGVERAVENVLGDDGEALKLARSELEQVTEQLTRELAQGQPGEGQRGEGEPKTPTTDAPGQPGEGRQASTEPNPNGTPSSEATEGQPGGQPGERPGQTPGERGTREGQRSLAGGGGGGERGDARGADRLEELLRGERRPSAPGEGYGGPITGDDFGAWADRLRDVEELVDQPALRDAVANARERARLMRQEFKRDLKKPDWAVVRLQVLQPLLEVRKRLGEELARRDSKDALVPIDRDPVPGRYSESVRRYYEELGK